MGPEDDVSLRDDIEAALGGDGGSPEPTSPEPTAPPAAPQPTEPAAPQMGDQPGTKPPVEGRDSLGRFLPKKGDVSSAVAPGATLGAGPSTAAPVPAPGAASIPASAGAALQAPAGWGPQVREHWATLPPPVQQQIHQREQQMQQWAQDTAPLRNAGQAFVNVIQPFQHTIQAEGVDPLTAVTNLMQATTTLRFGTPMEKANMLAQVVKAYGVDIRALDGALAGVAPPEGVPQQVNVQAEVQRALAPLMHMAQQREQAEVDRLTEQSYAELRAFAADPAHEFLGDVRPLMADMIEVAERQKYPLSLQDAYDRACALHPEVSKVIMARRQGANAQQLTQAAQRAKSAAVSVRGVAPVGNPNAVEPSSIRESIEAAIEAHSRV